MKKIEFKFPFYRFGDLGFHNCLASVYLCLENATTANTDYECQAMEGKGCNECWNCRGSLEGKSENLNNVFATMTTAHFVTRSSWAGEKTKAQSEIISEMGELFDISDKCADFLIGFTGYEYQVIRGDFKANITKSTDAGKPVIAKIKGDNAANNRPYRVIIGYDRDALIDADYMPAAEIKNPTSYDEIEFIYIFGEKGQQRFTIADVLKHVERVMNSDFSEGVWYDFAQQFDYEGEKMWELNVAEIKRRFNRFGDVSGWLTNQGHGLGVTFGDRDLLASLGADVGKLGGFLDAVQHEGDLLHGLAYQVGAIRNSINALTLNDDDEWPWAYHGLITATKLVLESIMECDHRILVAAKRAIRKLSC